MNSWVIIGAPGDPSNEYSWGWTELIIWKNADFPSTPQRSDKTEGEPFSQSMVADGMAMMC